MTGFRAQDGQECSLPWLLFIMFFTERLPRARHFARSWAYVNTSQNPTLGTYIPAPLPGMQEMQFTVLGSIEYGH